MITRIFKTRISQNTLFLLFLSFFLILATKVHSQCVDCNGTSTNGSFSSAIGTNNHANGDFSFAAGENSKANGRSSFSLGQRTNVYENYALGIGRYLEVYGSSSMAIGRFLKTLSPDAMVIGYGFSDTQTLDNNIDRSLMIGFESTKPTLFIGPSSGVSRTGRIGIGNVTNPQAKLHIRADEGEDASLLLEPSDPRRQQAILQMMDANTGITAGQSTGMQLYTDLGQMQFTAGQFTFEGPVKVAGLEVNGAYSLPISQGNPGEFLSHNGTWAVPSGSGGGSSYWQPSGSTIFYPAAARVLSCGTQVRELLYLLHEQKLQVS